MIYALSALLTLAVVLCGLALVPEREVGQRTTPAGSLKSVPGQVWHWSFP